ncbi:MAG TPA: response regulator [Burkholderiaceae bacterium]|nr:response regulator [Burkholderiaceae bacterium]
MHRDTAFIVDDDVSVRDSLSLLLSLRGYATATFASAEDFLSALQPQWHGCIVLDLRMPGMNGLELQRVLHERGSSLPVIVITAHGDVAAARQAFLADAVDFIEKPFDGDQLLSAIERALASPRVVVSAQESAAAASRAVRELSPRERQVMALMVKGLHHRRIGEELGISPRTVEVHKARVMEKLGASNLVELVRIADQGKA